MARAAVKAKQQAQRAKAQPSKARRRRGRHSGGGNPNQDLFFMRLRRHAKWAYVVLAILFAATFAAVGVGSGSSGLGQLFSGLFGGGGSNTTSISGAQAEIQKHPAKGYHDLALAYEAKGDTSGAVSALQSYVGLRPKDAAAWSQLGSEQLTDGRKLYRGYQHAQLLQQQADPGQVLKPAGKLGQLLGTNPIQQLATQKSSTLLSQYSQEATTEYDSALQSYQKAAKLKPKDPQAQFNLAEAAQSIGQYSVALTAWKTYLKLDPTSPERTQVKSLIGQLQKALAPPKKKK
jgi:tetratricopeptide (TPR) repeat protein